jgi:hypothetical protein
MKTVGFILGIFFLVMGISLFIAREISGFSIAFVTWGILLIYWAKKRVTKKEVN